MPLPIRPALLAGFLIFGLGCIEEVTTPGRLAEPPALQPSTVTAVVQEGEGTEAGTQSLTVRVLARDLTVAAYQGALRFKPGAYEVLGVHTPEGLEGESRVVNSAEAAEGRIRFAAFAVEEFQSDVAFTVVVRRLAADASAGVEVDLEVVGTPDGKAVEAGRIMKSRGLFR